MAVESGPETPHHEQQKRNPSTQNGDNGEEQTNDHQVAGYSGTGEIRDNGAGIFHQKKQAGDRRETEKRCQRGNGNEENEWARHDELRDRLRGVLRFRKKRKGPITLAVAYFPHPVAQAVSSALARFTSVFGMGTGGSMPL